jgi:hypothetical protein
MVCPCRTGSKHRNPKFFVTARKSPEFREIDELYGLPLGEFTAERNALARQLRAQGQREDAERVSRARKPTTAAWAVNQLVRRSRQKVSELFEVGDQLRKAQSKLMKGGDAGAIQSLAARERELVSSLVSEAADILREHGAAPGEATLEEIAETLHAAAIDEGVRAEVAAGTLLKERRAAGLGLSGVPAGRGKPKRAQERADARRRAARLQPAEKRLEDAQAARRAARRDAQAAARLEQKAAERERKAAEDLDRLRGLA